MCDESRRMKRILSLSLAAFLGHTITAAAQGADPRMRLEDFVKDAKKVEAFKLGVKVMKGRKPSDPRSWFFQAAIHGVPAEWIDAAKEADPDVATVDQATLWNQCPHSGPPSGSFLLWHRAYVFYFERILREASGDPTLSLPYWNYTDASQRGFPAIFATAQPNPISGEPANPLFDLRREIAFMFGQFDLSERAVSPAQAFDERLFFGATDDDGFAGGFSDDNPDTQGLVENRPHNSIHFAVGGVIVTGGAPPDPAPAAQANGLMGNVPTAAFDPIFWVHHANIDRLWAVWDCLPSREWGASPPAGWLDEAAWSFYDADSTLTKKPRKTYLDRQSLGVRYDTDDPSCRPLSATTPAPNPASTPGAPDARLRTFVVTNQKETGRLDQRIELPADQPVSRVIKLTTPPAVVEKSLRAAAPNKPRKVLLELRGIDYDQPPSVGFDVYVNLPGGMTPDSAGPHLVGSLALFGLKHDGHAGHAARPGTQTFDITTLARDPGFKPDAVTVTIVPFDLLQPKSGGPRILRSGGVRIESMRIVVVEGDAP